MTKPEAIEECAAHYEQQCERYPITREIPLSLYLRRNLPTLLRWRNSADYAAMLAKQESA